MSKENTLNINDTALNHAISSRQTEVALELIRNGADVNAVGGYGSTPLMLAIENNMTEVLLALIRDGVDIEDIHNPVATPLIFAILCRQTEVALVLIRAGADINAASRNKVDINIMRKDSTPLMLASKGGMVEIVEILINNGADLEAKSNSGGTALTYAIKCQKPEVALRLIEGGADVNAHGRFDFSPLTHALDRGMIEVAKKLIEKGAIVDQEAAEIIIKYPELLPYAMAHGDYDFSHLIPTESVLDPLVSPIATSVGCDVKNNVIAMILNSTELSSKIVSHLEIVEERTIADTEIEILGNDSAGPAAGGPDE